MELMPLRIFQGQVRDQCKWVLLATDDFNEALQVLQSDDRTLRKEASDRFWFSLQNLLTAAANISKALWGGGGKLADQRSELRLSLNVTDDSPLRPTFLRNHFEHFDERIDRWHAESIQHGYIDRTIGPFDMITGDFGETDWFRHYDPGTTTASFWGDTFNLQILVKAVADLLPIAEAEAAKPHWERPSPSNAGNGQ